MQFNRFNKLKSKSKSFWLLFILVVVVLVSVIIIAIVSINNQNDSEKSKGGQKDYKPKYDYTLISSDISCQQLPPYPGAKNTQNYCSGKLSVKDSSNTQKVITLTSSTYLYKNGGIVSLDTLNTLTTGKTKLEIKYDDTSKEVILVSYVQ